MVRAVAKVLLARGGARAVEPRGERRDGLEPRQLRRPGDARSAQDLDLGGGQHPARPLRGPGDAGRRRQPHPGRCRKLDDLAGRDRLYLQAPRRCRVVERRPRHGRRFRLFVPPDAGSRHRRPSTPRCFTSSRTPRRSTPARPSPKRSASRRSTATPSRSRSLRRPRTSSRCSPTRRPIRSIAHRSRSSERTGSSPATSSRTVPSPSPSSCPTITSSSSRIRNSTTPRTSSSTRSTSSRPRTARRRPSASRRASSIPMTTCRPSSSPTSGRNSATR